MYFAPTFVASLLLSASALVTPHVGDSLHRRHQHAAIARRAAPESPAPPMEASAAIPKRQLKKRCKPRRTSSGALSATSSAATSAAPLPSAAKPANVAAPVPSPNTTTNHDAPSSSPAPKPSPSPSSSSVQASKPSPSPSPAPSSSGGGSSQSNSLFSGTQTGADGTFYATGLGACGITNNDGDLIAAVSVELFDHFPGYDGVNPNTNPVCNKKVIVTFQGKSVTVTITDRCTGCAAKDLDFSPKAFNILSNPAVGRIHNMVWTWVD